ncbi:MAG: IscS subfamily cysteine desulfurase [Gammaproteobacteria bacterium]|nr:IscS subfamily cysteine desulfurase [Gammaproteobacteria bacterium]
MAIYLDYAATTPVDQRVADKMSQCLTLSGVFGNPTSSSHNFGWAAEKEIAWARQQVAEVISASPKEIIWTSGATESNNLAIKGAVEFDVRRGKHIITSKTEHKAVLDACAFLQREGFDVTYLDPNEYGVITADAVESALRADTVLISIMYVNNETGVVNDIVNIGRLARSNNVLFHVDGAQAIGKINVNVNADNIDLLSLASHKAYGPKGVGALYVRRKPRVRLKAQIHGGGHERGLRSGTLPTHQIVGMAEAYRLVNDNFVADKKHVASLAKKFIDGVLSLPYVSINADKAVRVGNIVNMHFQQVDGEALIKNLPDIAVSSGSACTSASIDPSHVLSAMGISAEQASSSIRFSFGRMTTLEEINIVVELVIDAVNKQRELSPAWQKLMAGMS